MSWHLALQLQYRLKLLVYEALRSLVDVLISWHYITVVHRLHITFWCVLRAFGSYFCAFGS